MTINYVNQLRADITNEHTTPDQIILQFSTCSPAWRKFSPKSLRHRFPIGLVFDKNWASPLIRRLCHSPFSHVDICLSDGNLLGASDQGENSPCIEGNCRGVAIRPPDYQEFGIRRHMIIKTDRAQFILAAALGQLGKPFDNSALYKFISEGTAENRNWRDPLEGWFCSELIAWSFELAGFWYPDDLLMAKDRVTPTDFLLLLSQDHRFVNRKTFWEPIR